MMDDTSKRLQPRRRPRQDRSRAMVEAIVEAAARVFRREGWSATTNRIAEVAGVGIGSLYEYFPNKEAILLALAEQHVAVAEREIEAALAASGSTAELLAALQAAILRAQRYPSQALEIVADVPRAGPELRARALALETRVVAALEARARAAGHADAALRARAAFGAIGHLTARASYTHPDALEALARHHLAMALDRLTPDAD